MSRPAHNRPSTWSPWLRDVHAAWRAATDAWEILREEFGLGYATETAEFAAANPAPRFADFLTDMARP